MSKVPNGDTETITDKALNSTKVGGISALMLAGLSAVVPVVQTLSEKNIHAGIIIGMEALAAVLACVAAWIYTVDARIRADLAKTQKGTESVARTAALQIGSSADELTKLDDLRLHKVLSDDEFKRAKDRVLNGQAA